MPEGRPGFGVKGGLGALVVAALLAGGPGRATAEDERAATRIVALRNEVRVFSPREHHGQSGEHLARGNRVDTLADATAEIAFADDARLQLGERTLLVVLEGNAATGSRAALLDGAVRARLAETSRPLRLTTSGSQRISVDGGEAIVDVDGDKTARVSVLRGRSTIESGGRRVLVAGGFGIKVEKEKAPPAPHMLPSAPVWKKAPPQVVIAIDGDGAIDATYGPATGAGTAPLQWHVQLAREPRFNDALVDARVPVTTTALRAGHVAPGGYFARVSAVDADGFEGRPGPVARVEVVVGHVDHAQGPHPMLTLPPEPFCGLDGAPLAHLTKPIELTRFRDHVVRCAPTADGAAGETRIAARRVDYVGVTARLDAIDREQRTARVTVSLTDTNGAPITDAELTAMASNRARVGRLEPAGAPGVYAGSFAWEPDTARFLLHVGVNGVVEGESNELVVTEPPVATPVITTKAAPVAPGSARTDVELGAFAGIGVAGDDLGLGGAAGAELGVRRDFGEWSASIALRPRFESYGRTGAGACDGGGSAIAAACAPPRAVTQYGYTQRENVFTLGLPIAARLGRRDALVLPYLGVEPGLVVDDIALKATASGRTLTDGDTVTRFAFAAFAGAELRATRDGRFFLEAGYRGSQAESRSWGDSTLGTFLLVAGWRGAL